MKKVTTNTNAINAAGKLALFGIKGLSYGTGLIGGAITASADALGEHIEKAPDSWSAGINKRSIKENYGTGSAVSYRSVSRGLRFGTADLELPKAETAEVVETKDTGDKKPE